VLFFPLLKFITGRNLHLHWCFVGTSILVCSTTELPTQWSHNMIGHDMPSMKTYLQFILCKLGHRPEIFMLFNCTECSRHCCELWCTVCFVEILKVYKVSEELRLLRPSTSSKTSFQNAFRPRIFYLFLVDDTISSLRSIHILVFSSLELQQGSKKYFDAYR